MRLVRVAKDTKVMKANALIVRAYLFIFRRIRTGASWIPAFKEVG